MNERTARALARRIQGEVPTVTVCGLRRHQSGGYEVECIDNVSGYPFVVSSPESWRERVLLNY